MKVQEAMAKTIATAHPSSTIKQVAVMMRREDCGFIPVVKDSALVGVITDRDLVTRFCADDGTHADLLTQQIGDIMTTSPVTVQADDSIEHAGHVMAAHQVRRLPVMDDDRLVGVLSFGNLEQAAHAHGACAEEVVLGVTAGA